MSAFKVIDILKSMGFKDPSGVILHEVGLIQKTINGLTEGHEKIIQLHKDSRYLTIEQRQTKIYDAAAISKETIKKWINT